MVLWDLKEQENLQDAAPRKRGLSIRVEKNVNKEVRCAILKFARWLRKEYSFPYRVIVYVKASERVRAMNGEKWFTIPVFGRQIKQIRHIFAFRLAIMKVLSLSVGETTH